MERTLLSFVLLDNSLTCNLRERIHNSCFTPIRHPFDRLRPVHTNGFTPVPVLPLTAAACASR